TGGAGSRGSPTAGGRGGGDQPPLASGIQGGCLRSKLTAALMASSAPKPAARPRSKYSPHEDGQASTAGAPRSAQAGPTKHRQNHGTRDPTARDRPIPNTAAQTILIWRRRPPSTAREH